MKDKLPEIWDNAIAILEPATTRTLLKQKCWLVGIEKSTVFIAVKPFTLIHLLSSKIPNLETVFNTLFGYPVKVTFLDVETITKEKEPEITNVQKELDKLDRFLENLFNKEGISCSEVIGGLSYAMRKLRELEKLEETTEREKISIRAKEESISRIHMELTVQEYNEGSRKRREKLTGNPSVF